MIDGILESIVFTEKWFTAQTKLFKQWRGGWSQNNFPFENFITWHETETSRKGTVRVCKEISEFGHSIWSNMIKD